MMHPSSAGLACMHSTLPLHRSHMLHAGLLLRHAGVRCSHLRRCKNPYLCPPYSIAFGQCRKGSDAQCCQQGQPQPRANVVCARGEGSDAEALHDVRGCWTVRLAPAAATRKSKTDDIFVGIAVAVCCCDMSGECSWQCGWNSSTSTSSSSNSWLLAPLGSMLR
jgi:hypothetical protein